MIQAIVQIFEKYYIQNGAVVNIYSMATNAANRNEQNGVIDRLLSEMRGSIAFKIFRPDSGLAGIDVQSNGLLLIDGYESFKRIWEIAENNPMNNRGYYTIIVTNVDGNTRNDSYDIVQRIFHDFWGNGISDVYVLANNDLYTFYPYDETTCNTAVPSIVNVLRNGNFTSKLNMFVDKFQNMHQCDMVVMANVFAPFTTYTMNVDGTRTLSGIEGDMMIQLAKMLNFTVVLRKVSRFIFRNAMHEMVLVFIVYFYF